MAKARRYQKDDSDLLTRRELAGVLDCNPRTIAKWQEEGLPVAVRGRGGRPSLYSESEVRAWLQAREEAARAPGAPLDLAQERARKEHWQALVAEQTYRTRERELLPRDEVEKTWSGYVAAVRAKLLAWPVTLADQVHRVSTLEGVIGVERELNRAVRDVLREFADGETQSPPTARRTRAKKRRAA